MKEKLPKQWVGCDIEEHYFGDDRKMGKQERKRASAKDRSKYKKTDREKLKHRPTKEGKEGKEHLLRGMVLSILPEGVLVDYEGQQIVCSLRGVLKKEKGQHKNLVTVGDTVLFEKSDSKEGMISHVEARRTLLSRADNLSRRKEQLIAANIDQVLITVSVVEPPLKPFLADRYIIATRKGGMDPVIVVNKMDLLHSDAQDNPLVESEKELLILFLEAYAAADIPVICVSTATGEGIEQLKAAMQGKSSVFSGQSGVGKSSLINAITGLRLEIGEIVEKTKKGAHTTTTTRLLPLEFGGWCIDTPGIKSFGVWDLQKEEVEHYFPEIFAKGRSCRYPDCSHRQEVNCAVHEAVEKGEISPLRYESYLALMESVSERYLRR